MKQNGSIDVKPVRLEVFDYENVELLSSRWKDQVDSAIDYYLSVSDDDILHGWRAAAGLPAPGRPLGGWCAENSDMVFGQWLSGMARLFRTTGNKALRDKALLLVSQWAATVGKEGNCGMSLYAYDKLLGGLVDLVCYLKSDTAKALIQSTMNWVMAAFSTGRFPSRADLINGKPAEWYTFAENIYRAYGVIDDKRYLDFGASYHYDAFWSKFLDGPHPDTAYHVHAYSHVNTFSSAAKAYEIIRDPRYLHIIRNGYDYLQQTQCYATGGYGPMERLVPPDGTLGRSVEERPNTFEAVCGTWAGFKLSRYLTRFTGESRYGDWAERLLYNGVGAALPITEGGKHFYYADYRLHGGMKFYKVSRYACCSGTYFQNMAEYANLIYFHGTDRLAVNLYLPSRLNWQRPDGRIVIEQKSSYPESPIIRFTLDMPMPSRFTLMFRIPEWTKNAHIAVNGSPTDIPCAPGMWAKIDRTWQPGTEIEVCIPLTVRYVPVDEKHSRRVALVRGPAVMVMDDWWMDPIPRLPEPDEVAQRIVEESDSGNALCITGKDGTTLNPRFRPYYAVGEAAPYRMYHDLDALPIPVW